jgi:hypothetical protein
MEESIMNQSKNRKERRLARIRENREIARIKFVSKNMKVLLRANYFSTKELLFLLDVSCYAGHYDNQIFFENLIAAERYGVKELTSLLDSLVNKEAILVDVKDVTATSQPLIEHYTLNPSLNLCLNPEIAYNGPFFKMPSKLYNLCRQFDFIERSSVQLPWKVRINERTYLGYFCKREICF